MSPSAASSRHFTGTTSSRHVTSRHVTSRHVTARLRHGGIGALVLSLRITTIDHGPTEHPGSPPVRRRSSRSGPLTGVSIIPAVPIGDGACAVSGPAVTDRDRCHGNVEMMQGEVTVFVLVAWIRAAELSPPRWRIYFRHSTAMPALGRYLHFSPPPQSIDRADWKQRHWQIHGHLDQPPPTTTTTHTGPHTHTQSGLVGRANLGISTPMHGQCLICCVVWSGQQ